MMKVQLTQCKLGYGGTQEEMKRLLADAEKLAGTKFDIKSYADIIEAIHVIQESMGITGTTAAEASETISGSFNAMKSAWDNMLTGLVLGGADFDRSLENLIESAKTFVKNLVPALVKALGGIGSLIDTMAPLIEAELPGLIQTLLPSLISAATSLVSGLIVALPDIVGTLIGELPSVMSQLWESVSTAFGEIPGLTAAKDFLDGLVKLITDNADAIKKLIPAVIGLVGAFKAFNLVKGLSGLFGGGGSGGSGGKSGAFNAKSVASTMGGVATALGGIGLIVAAFAALKQIEGYDEFMAGGGTALKQLCDIIADIGLVGAAFVGFVGVVGKNVTIADAATGIGDIAIALLGMEAIVAAFAGLAKIEGFSNFMAGGGEALQQLCSIINDIGLTGAAFVAFVAIVGSFADVGAAANGLGIIALALGGMEAVVLAFGALAQIPGIKDFINEGGEMLSQLFSIVGNMAGELVGGVLAGMSSGLETIGDNLAAFAESVAPAFAKFGDINTTGIGDFASALGTLIGVLVADNVTSFFFGDIDYAKFGTDLSNFATNASGFFSTVKDIPEESFGKMTSLFNALAGVKGLPTDGGVKGWLMGDIKFDKITSGLVALSGDEFIGAIKKIQDIPEAGFTAMSSLFNALADIKAMPKEGGVADWFTGSETTTLSAIAGALPGIASSIATFFTNLGGRTDFTPISSLFNTLSSIEIESDVADGTGLFGWGASELESMGTGLSNFATQAKTFFDTVNGLNTTNLSSLFDSLGTAGELPETLSGLDSSVGTALGNLVTTAETKLTELKGKFSDTLGEIIQLMNATATVMYSSGESIMTGVNSGMESMRSTLVATAASIAADIQSAFNVELDIHSPSRKTYKSGVHVGEGYDLGMQSKIPDLRATAARMGSAAIPYASRYSPESDAGTVYNSRTSSEYTTIAPSFNLTVSGTQDDRMTARKVKRWVTQSMNEFFESMERKSYVTREA